MINLHRGLYIIIPTCFDFNSFFFFFGKCTDTNVEENCQQNEIFEGKFIISSPLMERVGTDATKVLKVDPAPDGVEMIHTSEASEKCKVANNARRFVNLWNKQRDHP